MFKPAKAVWSALSLSLLLSPVAHAAVAVIGPDSDVLSYEIIDGVVNIRVCEENSTIEHIESPARCKLEGGDSSLITVPFKDFSELEKNGLSVIKADKLSAPERILLGKASTDVSQLEAKQREVEELKGQVDELEQFKKENPHDYNVAKYSAAIKDVTQRMMQSQLDLSHIEEYVAAKLQVGAVFDKLNKQMEGQAVGDGMLRASESSQQIGFRFLKDLAYAPSCSTMDGKIGVCRTGSTLVSVTTPLQACSRSVMGSASVGTMCIRRDAVWIVDSATANGMRTYTDSKHGITLTGTYGRFEFDRAQDTCKAAGKEWDLPVGYPRDMAGKNGNPNHASELVRLADDGIEDVVPELWVPYANNGDYLWIWSAPSSTTSDHYILQAHAGNSPDTMNTQSYGEDIMSTYVNTICVQRK